MQIRNTTRNSLSHLHKVRDLMLLVCVLVAFLIVFLNFAVPPPVFQSRPIIDVEPTNKLTHLLQESSKNLEHDSSEQLNSQDDSAAQVKNTTHSNKNTDVNSRHAVEMPAWVSRGSLVDENNVEFLVVSSQERFSQWEAQNELWLNVVSEVNRKIDEMIRPGAAEAIRISLEQIQEKWLGPEQVHLQVYRTRVPEDLDIDIGEEFQRSYSYHVMVKLDESFRDWSFNAWENELTKSRVLQLGLVGLSVLGVLALAAAYFHVDHRTRGFYSGRLQLLIVAGVLILIAGGLALSNTFPWL